MVFDELAMKFIQKIIKYWPRSDDSCARGDTRLKSEIQNINNPDAFGELQQDDSETESDSDEEMPAEPRITIGS